MSRSKKKVPITGNASGVSDKPGKQQANRKLRKRVNQTDPYVDNQPHLREVSDVYDFPKDGKKRFPKEYTDKDLRK